MLSNSSGTETLHYIGKTAEVSIKGSTTTTRLFIDDIAIISKTQQSGQSTASYAIRYTLRDRLGSVVSLTNEVNTLSEHRSYDPFGKPRKGDYRQWSPATLTGVVGTTPFTSRGFTDHEHLDGAQLIHMNGRVYDYNLGRFYSVDPVIQAPGNSQSLNSYSYIMNNPLAGTDPTGYTAECVEQCPEPPKRSEPKKRSGRSFVQDIIYQRPNNGAVQNTKSIESKTDAGGIGSQGDISSQSVSNNSTSEVSTSDAAGLANGAYPGNKIPEGWSAVTGEALEERFGLTHDQLNTEDGLNASIFYNKKLDTYVVAYAGTDPTSWADIKANIIQNFGFESAQYKQALNIADIVSSRAGGSNVVFTGHSLGGGLASASGISQGRAAFTFNAAGLHRNTVGGAINLKIASELIRAYYSASDPLNKWQDRMPNLLNKAVGRRISVAGAEGHSMRSMYDALRGGN